MLVPAHVAVGLLLGGPRRLQVMLVGVGSLGGHVTPHAHAGRQGALHEGVGGAQSGARVAHGVGVHVPGVRLHALLGDSADVGVGTGLLLHRALGGGAWCGHGRAGCTWGHQARLLSVALLQVTGQVISAAEALRTAWAQEVPASRVDHSVTPHVLAGVKTAVAPLTRVLALSHRHGGAGAPLRRRRPVNVAAEVLQERRRPLWAGHGRCAAVGRHQVAPVAQLRVVLLPTLVAVEELAAGGGDAVLHLALQRLLLLEHGWTEDTVALPPHGDTGREPEHTQTRLMRILRAAEQQHASPLARSQRYNSR